MSNYRKLYEQYYNCKLGIGIDIHHIDGDNNNNAIENLKAVTLQEHYEIHKSQNDFYAAYLIGKRMKIKPEDWKNMAKENGRISGKKNWESGIGLSKWITENPELFKENRTKAGKKSGKLSVTERTGIHSATPEQRKEWSSTAGKASPGFKLGHASRAGKIGGAKGGAYAKENKTGIFSLSPEKEKLRVLNAQITKLVKSGKFFLIPRKL